MVNLLENFVGFLGERIARRANTVEELRRRVRGNVMERAFSGRVTLAKWRWHLDPLLG